ncbi:ATP-dependent protease [Salinivibrio kushneri]|uniref:endopeptidase La n=1 Tax=Salinivibrio kushneri TaxID=1908198 RepID=A0AB36K2N9_9GAMM|nr:Lon protease family protein [Salinivibrio kushneri]OOE41556.1 ATP-dependent protease [Salinivibrio kushneri]QCP02106.1 Lon protease family protein [Salinivibrio kushneri]
MHEVDWRDAKPHYSQFSLDIAQFAHLEAASLLSLQSRLKKALTWLMSPSCPTACLTVMSADLPQYLNAYQAELATQYPEVPVVIGDAITESTLFGFAYDANKNVTASQRRYGLLHQAHDGVLILKVADILQQPRIWVRLKQYLSTGKLAWQTARADQVTELPDEAVNVRLVLVGDRQWLADFETNEPDLYDGLSAYAEYEQDIALDATTILPYFAWLKGLVTAHTHLPMTESGLVRLLQAGARESEDQWRMPLCPVWYHQLLAESVITASDALDKAAIDAAISQRYQRAAYLPERAIEDIHKGQVFIDTRGEHIGQINGLTVIEVPGHPMSYGEPARISCVVHSGDGDIADVERKAELAGNIHAKGMMIMQAFVSVALNLDDPLPYSASIVFEQSYSEVDGDSASLAELCAFVSALSQQPINQAIAITGAVDQFGRVQAVGGINEKIEGYYQVCAHRGLTGQQGVVLPKTNLSSLCLRNDVVDAIKAGQFHIWAVDDVEQALPLVTGLPFSGDDEETLLRKISNRINHFHTDDKQSCNSLFKRLKNWFGQY